MIYYIQNKIQLFTNYFDDLLEYIPLKFSFFSPIVILLIGLFFVLFSFLLSFTNLSIYFLLYVSALGLLIYQLCNNISKKYEYKSPYLYNFINVWINSLVLNISFLNMIKLFGIHYYLSYVLFFAIFTLFYIITWYSYIDDNIEINMIMISSIIYLIFSFFYNVLFNNIYFQLIVTCYILIVSLNMSYKIVTTSLHDYNIKFYNYKKIDRDEILFIKMISLFPLIYIWIIEIYYLINNENIIYLMLVCSISLLELLWNNIFETFHSHFNVIVFLLIHLIFKSISLFISIPLYIFILYFYIFTINHHFLY